MIGRLIQRMIDWVTKKKEVVKTEIERLDRELEELEETK